MRGVLRLIALFVPADERRDCVRWFGDLATTNFSLDDLGAARRSRLEDAVAGVVGSSPSGADEGAASGGVPECGNCGAEGMMRGIWEAPYALQDRRFCERVGADQQRRLRAAVDWFFGDTGVKP
ncbi:MAG: hypothetical protein ACOC5E_02125, partial [Acidobacteriota bacterium]